MFPCLMPMLFMELEKIGCKYCYFLVLSVNFTPNNLLADMKRYMKCLDHKQISIELRNSKRLTLKVLFLEIKELNCRQSGRCQLLKIPWQNTILWRIYFIYLIYEIKKLRYRSFTLMHCNVFSLVICPVFFFFPFIV